MTQRQPQKTFLWHCEWVNNIWIIDNQCFYFLSVPEKQLEALIPLEQVIAWKWAIILAFSVPEVGTFIRSIRLCFFKSLRSFTWMEFGIVLGFESLHVIGSYLLVFKILPELDVIQGAMLMNCLCFVPSILCKMWNHQFLVQFKIF